MENKGLSTLLKGKEKIVVALGIAGMILIFLSGIPMPEKAKTTAEMSTAQYVAALQKQMEATLGAIEGVGKIKVMVTVEGSTQYVYAQDEKSSLDEEESYNDQKLERLQKKQDIESMYIFVDGSNRQAQKIQEIEPQVKGVVVVCQGAGSSVVKMRVTEAVTTLLAIDSNQVCVALYTDK